MTNLKGRHVAGLTGALVAAGLLITAFEGRVLHVYPDPVTHSTPWTYCDGETQHPKPGHTYTDAECDAETAALIRRTDAAVLACTRPDLPGSVRASSDSLAWNIGPGNFCTSTAARLFRAGQYRAGCQAMTAWHFAAGKSIPGLVIRRGAERDYCLKDVR